MGTRTRAHMRASIRKRARIGAESADGRAGGRTVARIRGEPTSGRAVLRPRDRGTKKTFPFSWGGLGLDYIVASRSHARRPCIWYRRSVVARLEWWLDGLQAHVTTPPVPFLWYRSQGLTPLSDSHTPLAPLSSGVARPAALAWDQIDNARTPLSDEYD